MKFTKGIAIYTGGGFYVAIGQTDNGNYFYGCIDWCELFDTDTRTVNEYDELACMYNEWCDEHIIKSNRQEVWKAFEDFCKRLDNNEPNITEGYEKWSNYIPGEVTELIDFSEMNI